MTTPVSWPDVPMPEPPSYSATLYMGNRPGYPAVELVVPALVSRFGVGIDSEDIRCHSCSALCHTDLCASCERELAPW